MFGFLGPPVSTCHTTTRNTVINHLAKRFNGHNDTISELKGQRTSTHVTAHMFEIEELGINILFGLAQNGYKLTSILSVLVSEERVRGAFL